MKLRVLVVDADIVALATARRLLGKRFDVAAAGHVVDGLMAAATLLPDVLVAGNVAPLDAGTIARRLAAHEATRHVRVVPRGDVAKLREMLEKLVGG